MSKLTVIPWLVLFCCASNVWGQQAIEIEGRAPRSEYRTLPFPTPARLATRTRKSSALEQEWQQAENDKDRDAVRAKAREYLDRQFEADMKRREKELREIETRIETLHGQLEKRVANKDEIIGLQLKQMTMSWDGLGWSEPAEHHNQFTMAWSPQPPMPPTAPTVDGQVAWTLSSERNGIDHESDLNLAETVVAEAVAGKDWKKLLSLAEQVVARMEDLDPVSANDLVWKIHGAVGDKVKSKRFWLILAKATEDAADGVDSPVTLGNILDTAARCYYLGGEKGIAIKLQTKAVAASAEGRDGEADEQIAGFLKELKEATK